MEVCLQRSADLSDAFLLGGPLDHSFAFLLQVERDNTSGRRVVRGTRLVLERAFHVPGHALRYTGVVRRAARQRQTAQMLHLQSQTSTSAIALLDPTFLLKCYKSLEQFACRPS